MTNNDSETATMQIVKDFNDLFLDFIRNIADVCPNSLIGTHKKAVEREIVRPENKKKFIDVFVGKVLQYKEKIDSGDESFFVNKSYDKDVEGDDGIIHQVFEFKSIWTTLKRENKDLVIQYIQLLCELAQKYFMIIYG